MNIQFTEYSNVPEKIKSKIGRNLHNQPGHPLEIVKKKIYEYFDTKGNFIKRDDLWPVVSIENNFDNLLTPKNHPSRSKSDTYYVSENYVLRSHMTAHDPVRLSNGEKHFLSVGDVYRKDEADRTHYPVFHQLDGVGQVPKGKNPTKVLLEVLGGLCEWLFPGQKYRVNDDYFPFTHPSYEIEVYHKGEWLEILGGGILQPQITKKAGVSSDIQMWAFGVGLERLAMILFEIPDIRLFWSTHPRFLDQFSPGKIVKFKPFSNLPSQKKDISFWINEKFLVKDTDVLRWIQDNDFFEIIRGKSGDLVESVTLMDSFYHKKKKRHSRTYTILYRPVDPDMDNPSDFTNLVNEIQEKIRKTVQEKLEIELR
jgi:phenylalanyl-tRNA synthetase alpha chain